MSKNKEIEMMRQRTRRLLLAVLSLALTVQVAFAQETLWEKAIAAGTRAREDGR